MTEGKLTPGLLLFSIFLHGECQENRARSCLPASGAPQRLVLMQQLPL